MLRSLKARYGFQRTAAKPKVNQELEGFDIKINSAGEIESSYSIDQLNEFLNRKVYDKKLKNDVNSENP
ncbi:MULTISPECIES: hypothetical protein [Flammeovirga]|uniref:Uncharacterized protein n=1 Tax=Flammeovirga agarivorans TaxID=2726742 RepID=A0A7X8SHN0_9BACT|nr:MULTISPECIES: hypothetical protein [Flammeovirga]NLR90307.1 hypothetical protein [Flammeovirga agarivorans]